MELFTLKDDDCIYDTIVKEHLNERKIILNEDIDDNVIENICLMIMKWNQEDKYLPVSKRKKIYIYILILAAVMSYVVIRY